MRAAGFHGAHVGRARDTAARAGAAFTPIETERLRLRRFRATTPPRSPPTARDPEVARFQGWEAGYPLRAAERFVREMAVGAIRACRAAGSRSRSPTLDTDALLGDCVLHPLAADPGVAEIGYTLAPRTRATVTRPRRCAR